MVINLTQMRIWEINPITHPCHAAGQVSLLTDADGHAWGNGLSQPGYPHPIPVGEGQLPLGNDHTTQHTHVA